MKRIFSKKGNVGAVVGIFAGVLIIAAVVAMTFLFVLSFKTTTGNVDSQRTSAVTVNNETVTSVTGLGKGTAVFRYPDVHCTITRVTNATTVETINTGNYTVENCKLISITSGQYNNTNWNVTYSYDYANGLGYNAINSTEATGVTLVSYLPLVFLALIFGVILIVILKFVAPYISLKSEL